MPVKLVPANVVALSADLAQQIADRVALAPGRALALLVIGDIAVGIDTSGGAPAVRAVAHKGMSGKSAAAAPKRKWGGKRANTGRPAGIRRPDSIVTKIIDLMRAEPGEISVTDLCERFGALQSTVSSSLTYLKDAGEVVRVSKGVWRLAGKDEASADGPKASGSHEDSIASRALSVLSEASEPIGIQELAKRMNRPASSVSTTLSRLAYQGRVIHEGMTWRLAREDEG